MKKIFLFAIPVVLILGIKMTLSSTGATKDREKSDVRKVNLVAPKGKAIAAFAEGCFWHSEIIFEAIPGVDSVISGYAGGKTTDPTYEKIETGTTGHAETSLVYYDPKVVSYKELLNAFYLSHNSEQVNGQGNDEGTQYRSIAFYSNEAEHKLVVTAKKQLILSGKKAVTEIDPLKAFYRAEGYHQNYIAHNPNNGYVRNVSIPDYKEFRKVYKGALKKDVIK